MLNSKSSSNKIYYRTARNDVGNIEFVQVTLNNTSLLFWEGKGVNSPYVNYDDYIESKGLVEDFDGEFFTIISSELSKLGPTTRKFETAISVNWTDTNGDGLYIPSFTLPILARVVDKENYEDIKRIIEFAKDKKIFA